MKILAFLILSLLSIHSYSQEFEIRMNVTSCSTFTVQIRSINGSYLPQSGDYIDAMDFSVIAQSSFALTIGSSFNGFNMSQSGTPSEGVYSGFAYSDGGAGLTTLTTSFSLNSWVDVCSFTITSGTTDLIIATSTELPVYSGAYFGSTPTSTNFIELGVASNSAILSKRWEGGTSTAWATAANWCPAGVPSSGEKLVILDQANDPILSASIALDSLHIASGAKLTLSGNQLTLDGGLTGTGMIIGSSTSSIIFNGTTSSTLYMDTTQWDTTNLLQNLTVNLTGGASLTLGSKVGVLGILLPTAGTITTGGNLRICARTTSSYGQIDPTGSGTISGTLTVQKALSNTNAGWRHIGLPVIGTINDIDSFDILDSSHTVPAEKNIKYWNAVPVSGNDAPGWTVPDSTFGPTVGYAIYGNNSSGGKHDFSQIWSASGTISSGQRDFVVKNSVAGGSSDPDDQGWNLIANPYASNLDVSTLWTTTLNSASYKAIHVYDQINDQYTAICSSGVTIITNGGASGTPNSASVVAPFQAFWVKASSNTTLSFTAANQTISSSGLGTFMKKNYDLARIDVYDADSAWDQTVVYFDENGNPGMDNGLDAFKLYSYDAAIPSLYSLSPDGNYAINALNSAVQTHSLPLGFRSSKTGQMSFNLNTSELDAKWFVYLEDKQLGIFYDIKANPYTFNHTQNSDSRFVLHFQTYGLSAEKLVSDIQNMNISGDGSAVYVFVPAFYKDQNYQLEVIDMAGRVVYTDTKLSLNHGMNTLNLNLNANAYYAVRIKAAEGIVSGKVQIR